MYFSCRLRNFALATFGYRVVRHGLVLLEVPVASPLYPSAAWSLLRRR